MEKKYEQLLNKLERELENYIEMRPLERMRCELSAVRASLATLQQITLEAGFATKAEEVDFFKNVKPRFYSLMVLSAERYGFEMARPLRKGKGMDAFYASQLHYISRFFDQHAFLYQYFRMRATELDLLYFVRGGDVAGIIGGGPARTGTFVFHLGRLSFLQVPGLGETAGTGAFGNGGAIAFRNRGRTFQKG